MKRYILGIDQSTQGTKGLLFDEKGALVARSDVPHKQITNEKGSVEHDPEEIYANTLKAVKSVTELAGIDRSKIAGLGISNQRETSLVWQKDGTPVANAIVWQDSRAESLCEELRKKGNDKCVGEKTGIPLSPYFPAAKLAWLGRQIKEEKGISLDDCLMGTVDTYLIYRLTEGKEYRTDYSNASRTQLFNIFTLKWDEELCRIFDIPIKSLAEVTDSDGWFGETDFGGYLDAPIPIHGVMGDSHGALFGQGCVRKGMVKATYGTGSSVMMNVGTTPVRSRHGLVSSLAWKIGGEVSYVLEGNINYTGAVISWMKNDLRLIESAEESESLARAAKKEDKTYLVPAFTGLGAPYWRSNAVGVFYGMSRTTGRAELVKAGVDSIAYQVADILFAMEEDAGIAISELRADGGPTNNAYLMELQSDMCKTPVRKASIEELSGFGAALAAGRSLGIYAGTENPGEGTTETEDKLRFYYPGRCEEEVSALYQGWKEAVGKSFS